MIPGRRAGRKVRRRSRPGKVAAGGGFVETAGRRRRKGAVLHGSTTYAVPAGAGSPWWPAAGRESGAMSGKK